MRSDLVGRVAAFTLPIAIAAALTAGLLAARTAPERAGQEERRHAVRVLEIAPMDVAPRAVGFGAVQPATTWQGVAEVRFRVQTPAREPTKTLCRTRPSIPLTVQTRRSPPSLSG